MAALESKTRQRLDRGEGIIETEPVDGSPLPRVTVLAVIEAAPERVWRVIDAVRDYGRTMGGVKSASELSRDATEDGERIRARVTVKMPFPLKDLTSVTDALHSVVPGERYRRAWDFVEGDYDANSGSWTLTPFEGDPARTLVTYDLHAVPHIRIPSSLYGLAQKKVIPRLIDHLRRQV